MHACVVLLLLIYASLTYCVEIIRENKTLLEVAENTFLRIVDQFFSWPSVQKVKRPLMKGMSHVTRRS